jgi:hypothetical protein
MCSLHDRAGGPEILYCQSKISLSISWAVRYAQSLVKVKGLTTHGGRLEGIRAIILDPTSAAGMKEAAVGVGLR